ncbi:MAG: Rne/Rng family ribonuclease [Planctomycetota bacterium]
MNDIPEDSTTPPEATDQSDGLTTEDTADKSAAKKKSRSKKKSTKKTAKKKATARKKTKKKATAKSEEPEVERDSEAATEEPAEDLGDAIPAEAVPELEAEPDSEDEDNAAKPAAKKAKKKADKRGSRRSGPRRDGAHETPEETPEERAARPKGRLVVNYIPGEECRVALLESGRLQEYEAERFDAISRVGNIYLGKVTNVEPGIQAAFVDFGVEEAGFLHVSDLHPMHFPGSDNTERVGKKTPRRERPPIEKALKRGQQILVQVLKDGVGTKGPALTSYLSIPGRFLVMMPQMDKVGVSRKVDDDDTRKTMKEILDQLDLPEGFGFILRTAGLGRTKTELKRDLSYLQRLWKDLERRKKGSQKPRLLYSESDLLVRTIRDRIGSDIDDVVLDSPAALDRVGRFMKIVAPRTNVTLKKYLGGAPIFEAFKVEEQISQMHAREVPLPSGGRLVIDETEALVAIDVNSGKMRSRDAEENALKANLEAADEICRQLRLRDMGGLVINDLIDMRHARHRKQVEQRFKDNLKRDKAKSTTLPISAFGIMEMTRQRMTASHESVHFTGCPTCAGRGLVQRPASVADDALRNVAALLGNDKVATVELVVGPRVAGELLSSRRLGLGRLERAYGKHVDVRVSDSLGLDQVRCYAYDDSGSDLDIDRLKGPGNPEKLIEDFEITGVEQGAEETDDWAIDLSEEAADAAAAAIADNEPEHEIVTAGVDDITDEDDEGGNKKRRRRRRRRGRGKGGENAEGQTAETNADQEETIDASEQPSEDAGAAADSEPSEEGEGGKKKRRRRRGGRGRNKNRGEEGDAARGSGEGGEPAAKPKPRSESKPEQAPKSETSSEPKPKKSLYGKGRRKLAPSELSRVGMED